MDGCTGASTISLMLALESGNMSLINSCKSLAFFSLWSISFVNSTPENNLV